MEVKVIESGDRNLIEKVWNISRPNNNNSIRSILEIDAPINDFSNLVLDIKSTILEREIIASFRNHIMWASTSRVEDPIGFTYDGESNWAEECRIKMSKDKIEGINQNEYRLHLPLIAHTRYSIKVSFRDIVRIQKQFKYLSGINKMFNESSDIFYRIIEDYSIPYEYKHIDVNPLLQRFQLEKVIPIESFTSIKAVVPFSLRTHLIRHHNVMIKDNIKEILLEEKTDLNTPICIMACASNDTWHHIYTSRSCWLSHYSMWSKILTPISNTLGFTGKDLPCSGTSCPYSGDAQNRVDGLDPGAPCPIYANINSIKIDTDAVNKQIDEDHRPNFWKEYLK